MEKRGSTIRAMSAIIGAVMFLVALYFLNNEELVYAGVIGIAGILLITISLFPFIKSNRYNNSFKQKRK